LAEQYRTIKSLDTHYFEVLNKVAELFSDFASHSGNNWPQDFVIQSMNIAGGQMSFLLSQDFPRIWEPLYYELEKVGGGS